MRAVGRGSIEIETRSGARLHLVADRARYAALIDSGQLALSPREILCALDSAKGGPEMLDAIAEIKRIDPACRIVEGISEA